MQSRVPVSRSRRLAGGLVALAFVATACGDGDAERSDLTQMLTEVAGLSEDQAECVAVEIYDSGDWTQDDLNSVAKGFTNDDGTEKVDGFTEAFDTAIASCS